MLQRQKRELNSNPSVLTAATTGVTVCMEPEMIEIYWHFHKICSNILRNTSIGSKAWSRRWWWLLSIFFFFKVPSRGAWQYFLKNLSRFSMNFCWCWSLELAVGSPANWAFVHHQTKIILDWRHSRFAAASWFVLVVMISSKSWRPNSFGVVSEQQQVVEVLIKELIKKSPPLLLPFWPKGPENYKTFFWLENVVSGRLRFITHSIHSVNRIAMKHRETKRAWQITAKHLWENPIDYTVLPCIP